MIETRKVLDARSIKGSAAFYEVMDIMCPRYQLKESSYLEFTVADNSEWDDNGEAIIDFDYPALSDYLLNQGVGVDEPILILLGLYDDFR